MRSKPRLFRPGILLVGLAVVSAAFALRITASQWRESLAPASASIPKPGGLSGLRILLGIKDSNPTDRDTELSLSEGKVIRITESEQDQPARARGRRRLSSRRLQQGNQSTIQAAVLLADLDAQKASK